MSRSSRLALAAVMLAFAAAPADAQMLFPSRTSSTLIQTTKKDLSDATATITATTQVAAGATGTRDLDFYVSSNLASFSTKASGDVGVAAGIVGVYPEYGVAEVAGTVTATGRGGGSFAVVEGYGRDTDPYGVGPLYRYADASFYQDRVNYGFLPAFTQTGLPSIEYFLPIGGAGLVDQSGVFVAELMIAGDFSSTGGLGSRTGQHYLAHLNPAWAITQDFVYDPATNLTTFRAVNPAYDYDDPNPYGLDLDVFFFGAPAAVAGAVPEPATWASMTIGLALIGAALRRRRTETRRFPSRVVARC